ncbi:MAG: DUF1015 domain-containing protein [Phycisphaerales bacterium]
MPQIHPFVAIRPASDLVARVVGLKRDVETRDEALAAAEGNPLSFLHVCHAEIDVEPPLANPDPRVPEQAARAWKKFLDQGVFIEGDRPRVFVYRQSGIVGGVEHTQTGLICCVSLQDYDEGRIKKHEKTRAAKEDAHVAFLTAVNAHTAPVLLAFQSDPLISGMLERETQGPPLYEFEDAIRHQVWRVDDETPFVAMLSRHAALYIADGHHRSAAASRVSEKIREERGITARGAHEFDRYLAALFPTDELRIFPFHRVVTDLNGLTPEAFLDALASVASIESVPSVEAGRRGSVLLRFASDSGPKGWRRATFRPDLIDRDDPVRQLDVALLNDLVLDPILGVRDPRSDPRLETIAGSAGVEEVEGMLERGQGAVAFVLEPATFAQMAAVADAGMTMPPKSTCFEPKIRPGLLAHMLE